MQDLARQLDVLFGQQGRRRQHRRIAAQCRQGDAGGEKRATDQKRAIAWGQNVPQSAVSVKFGAGQPSSTAASETGPASISALASSARESVCPVEAALPLCPIS